MKTFLDIKATEKATKPAKESKWAWELDDDNVGDIYDEYVDFDVCAKSWH